MQEARYAYFMCVCLCACSKLYLQQLIFLVQGSHIKASTLTHTCTHTCTCHVYCHAQYYLDTEAGLKFDFGVIQIHYCLQYNTLELMLAL